MNAYLGKPTPKKIFEIKNVNGKDQIVWHYYEKPQPKGLDLIYEQFFKKNECSQLIHFDKKYSRIDAIIQSASTAVIIEYKNRGLTSIADFYTGIIENQKFQSLKECSQLLGNCPAWFICDYSDAVCCWQLDFTKDYRADHLPAQVSDGSSTKVLKPIYYLEYSEAAIVVGKKTWQRADVNQLNKYLELKRNERTN